MVLVDKFSRPGKGAKGGSDESNQATGWFSMFSVAAYRPYFDVDTSDVLERIKDSLFPFRGSFNEKTTDNPDLSVFFLIYIYI
jgi:protein YIPF1/2